MKHYLSRFWLLIVTLLFIAGCAQNRSVEPDVAQQPVAQKSAAPVQVNADKAAKMQAETRSSERLCTQWGEGIGSSVTTVDLRRVSNTPLDIAQISYAASRQSGRSINEAMIANGRVGVSILNDANGKWPLTQNGSHISLKGKKGARYQLHYRNYSGKTYEIVATVDGLDVINGSAGSLSNSGYVLKPNGTLVIEGFRKNNDEVAAFRFSAIDDAYAANTSAGSVKNTGVIGTAVFELNAPQVSPPRRPDNHPQAFPADDNGYAPPPRY